MKNKYLEYMTWPQAEVALKSQAILLWPLGARLKEHGRHLPLNNDWLIAEYYALRVAAQCDVLVLPTLQHGFYPAFLDYPGSIHVSKENFKNYILDIIRSLAKHSDQKIYILNTGISTIKPLSELKQDLASEQNSLGKKIHFAYSNFMELTGEFEKNILEQECGSHADEGETSMMLYMYPEIVDMNLAEKDIHSLEPKGPLSRTKDKPGTRYSPTGAWGDPTLASKEKGEKMVEYELKQLILDINKFSETSK